MLNVTRIAGLVLLSCTLACGGKSPDEQLLKATDRAAAWIPSLQMTAEKWSANSVPSTFARSAAQAAGKEFEKAKKAAEKSSASEPLRSRVMRDLDVADGIADSLAQAADRNDRRIVPAAVRTLVQLDADFDALEKQYGGGQ